MSVLKLLKFLAVMEMDHIQNKGQQTHMAIHILLCSNGFADLFTPVIHILDIGCTGVNETGMKSDS